MLSIHDPIHGTIEVSGTELRLIDSRALQRLRFIKQLGFADLAFPGATHTRYAHSLGAMEVATRMGDRLLRDVGLPDPEQRRLRQSLRLALLFHDVGHPPMSHLCEVLMPQVGELGLGEWYEDPTRQATHEDYTVKLLVDAELGDEIERAFGDLGVTGARLAALICGRPPPGDETAFVIGGQDYLPLLSQLVSGELDADRLDYLLRDSYYCGVGYGAVDLDWLINNLTLLPSECPGGISLALQHKAVWAFESFLLSRFHMFLAVYFHHTPICFDTMLTRFLAAGEYRLPDDVETYLACDDAELLHALRCSNNPWARRITQRRPYRLLIETHDFDATGQDRHLEDRLLQAGIDCFRTHSTGLISKYVSRRERDSSLRVLERQVGRVSRIEEYTPLYRRFDEAVGISRIYCRPDQLEQAQGLLPRNARSAEHGA